MIPPLTDEQIRVKVAATIGTHTEAIEQHAWNHLMVPPSMDDCDVLIDGKGKKNIRWPERSRELTEIGFEWPPNFPHDLNACAEMEKTLSGCMRVKYINTLMAMCNPIFATARQRATAFLLTKGVIKEEKV